MNTLWRHKGRWSLPVSFRGSDAKKINDAFSEVAMQVAMQRVWVLRVFGS